MIPERYASQTYAILRVVFGLMYLTYGVQKFGMLGGVDGAGASAPFLSWPYGIAGLIEVVAGVLITIGLLTKPAAFVASGEMAVAYFMGHQSVGGGLPVQNMGIPAVLFCFAFLYIASRGAGIWSADAAMGGGSRAASARA